VRVAWCDELSVGFGWTEPGYLQRTAHAVVAGAGVWFVDPFEADSVDERARALGEPVGVVQLLDRHGRDCASFAERYRVPLHRVPAGSMAGAPFEMRLVVDRRGWQEAALWWPEGRVLACGDALGTARYFLAPGESLGVHPLLRPFPPSALRDMATRLAPRHVLCGHGAGIHGGEAALALEEALTTARSRIPRYLSGLVRGRR
jgi:hypothetical protein